MLTQIRTRLARTGFIKKLLENPVDLEIFKKSPSPRFLIGTVIIAFSYLIGWPLIALLGVIAFHLKKPLIFAIGSPICYGISHFVFLFGAFVAGRDAMTYMNTFLKWSLGKFLRRVIGREALLKAGLDQENPSQK